MSKKNKKKHVNNQKPFEAKVDTVLYDVRTSKGVSICYNVSFSYNYKNLRRTPIKFKLEWVPEVFMKNLHEVKLLVDKTYKTGKFSIVEAPHLFGGLCHFASVSDEFVSFEGYLKLMLAESDEKEFVECMQMTIMFSKRFSNVIVA